MSQRDGTDSGEEQDVELHRKVSFGGDSAASSEEPIRTQHTSTVIKYVEKAPRGLKDDEANSAIVVVNDENDEDDDVKSDSSETDRLDDQRSQSSTARSSSVSQSADGGQAGLSVFRCGGAKIKIPFTVWTFAAMMVPVVLLLVITSIAVSDSAAEISTIQQNAGLARKLGHCVSALAAERGSSGPWLTRGLQSDMDALATARAVTDSACTSEYANELRIRGSQTSSLLQPYTTFVANSATMAVWRNRVDLRTSGIGQAARSFYTAFIDNSTVIVTPIADTLVVSARLFSELKLILTCFNYIGLARGVGNAIAALTPGAPIAAMTEYQQAYAQCLLGRELLRGLSSPRLNRQFLRWEQLNATQLMWSYLGIMASNATVIQLTRSATWWPVMSAGLDALTALQLDHVDYVASSEIARPAIVFNSVYMSLGVFACLVAAGLLAFQQSRVRQQLEAQVANMARTKKAVSAFVPKFFLRQMGYTAITQVKAGECTSVALAMLFADIRRFTTVSEGMASEALFDWVQGYFKRMTVIVEAKRGNINQFIGDALFAVFATAVDSVRCAVAMQCDVQQLNVQRLCDADNMPVEIGVGIHHDVVALGILGDEGRHTCTTISSSVNLASRLEGLTKQLGCRIIASDAVVSQLTDAQRKSFRSRRLGSALVKGSGLPVAIHDIFQADERELQHLKTETKETFEKVIDFISKAPRNRGTGASPVATPTSAVSTSRHLPRPTLRIGSPRTPAVARRDIIDGSGPSSSTLLPDTASPADRAMPASLPGTAELDEDLEFTTTGRSHRRNSASAGNHSVMDDLAGLMPPTASTSMTSEMVTWLSELQAAEEKHDCRDLALRVIVARSSESGVAEFVSK